jgi:hypothetical protein
MVMDRSEAHDLTLEQIFDQIEHGEWRTTCLIQFLSREDAEVEPMAASIDESGHVKIRNGQGETTEPKSPGQLRQRMKVVAHGYVMASFKYPQKHALQNLWPELFMTYVDFLLGDQVMGLRAKNEDGSIASSPSFALVLSYDHQIRKETMKLMNDGMGMPAALEKARKDVALKERFFVTPASLNALTSVQDSKARSRSPKPSSFGHSDTYSPVSSRKWVRQFQKKGNCKGKRKNALNSNLKIHSRSPDGQQICFRWNNQSPRCRYDCGSLRICQACFQNHPLHACPGTNAPPKDTVGGGKPKNE